jgi:hypothetical protein
MDVKHQSINQSINQSIMKEEMVNRLIPEGTCSVFKFSIFSPFEGESFVCIGGSKFSVLETTNPFIDVALSIYHPGTH